MADPLADPAVQQLFAVLPGARLVGGCVRDRVAGLGSADIDLASPLPPGDAAAALRAAGVRVIPTGLAHGTVTALIDGRPFEVTTLRRDLVTDGRHAEVAWTDDWREDAARRDFTINAMSLSQDGVLHDYFGGEADLREHRVRFVGNARTRVAEDTLRILRFFRFYARYGATPPDADAVAAIQEGLGGLARLSAERVWSELKRILQVPNPMAALHLMQQTGVLGATVPEVASLHDVAHLPVDPVLRLAALMAVRGDSFSVRLKLSTAEAVYLDALQTAPDPRGNDDDLRRLLADHALPVLTGRTWLGRDPPAAAEAMRQRLRTIPTPAFPLEGRDVLALGQPPGPAVGALLRGVRTWWLDHGCTATADECRAELTRLVAPP